MQTGFGSGAVWFERIDSTGNLIGPVQGGVLQGVSLDFELTAKELYGSYQWPVAIARAEGKITGKSKQAGIKGRMYSDIFFGLPAATGQYGVVQDEPDTVPTASPFAVTVTTQPTNYAEDLGVRYAATGVAFVRNSPPAAAGQYSQSGDVYTFASADAGAGVLISYHFTNTTTGLEVTITQELMGTTPTFKTTLYNPISPGPPGSGSNSKPVAVRLNACHSSKFTLPTVYNNWIIQDFDFAAFADASGTIGYLSTVE